MERVFIVGTGRIGGSTGLALRAAGFAGRIDGWDSSQLEMGAAVQMGAIDDRAGSREEALELARLEMSTDGSLVPKQGENFLLAVDLVVLAIGQGTHTEFLSGGKVQLERGRIVIDRATGQTSNAKYFAGGDCTNGGREVVDAVADGKRAGVGIAVWLEGLDANA